MSPDAGNPWRLDRVDRKIWILVALVAIAGSLLCTGGHRAERRGDAPEAPAATETDDGG